MPITLNSGRQAPLIAKYDFTYADLTDNTYAAMVEVPTNAVVSSVKLVITTLFNSATTDVFSIGDQPAGAAARATHYAAASADVTAVPTQILGAVTGYKYLNGGTVGIVWDGTGAAPSAGAGTLMVEYYIDGRATECNP